MILLLIISGIGVIMIIGLILAILIVWNRSWAKNEAKKYISMVKSPDRRRINRILKVLAHAQNDREALRLFDQLSDLNERYDCRTKDGKPIGFIKSN